MTGIQIYLSFACQQMTYWVAQKIRALALRLGAAGRNGQVAIDSLCLPARATIDRLCN
jgi:hypothetical protein